MGAKEVLLLLCHRPLFCHRLHEPDRPGESLRGRGVQAMDIRGTGMQGNGMQGTYLHGTGVRATGVTRIGGPRKEVSRSEISSGPIRQPSTVSAPEAIRRGRVACAAPFRGAGLKEMHKEMAVWPVRICWHAGGMSTETLNGKKAIVTGGTRGIGRAIAKMLLEEGVDVAICGRTDESTAQAVQQLAAETGGRVYGAGCDVTQMGEIQKFFAYTDDRLGSLDILVNNAGIGIFRSVADMEPEQWQKTIDTNLTSVFHFCHLAMQRFRASGGGFVVNVSSLAGRNPFAGGAAYNASKFGLNGFTEAFMLDHRNDRIRVCSIMPGSVSTEFSGTSSLADWKIQPEDIAEVVRMVLRMPERTMVSRVEIRPSRPAK